MPTTIDIETELSAVNSILGSIGQSPVTTLGETSDGTVTYANPEIAFIYNFLKECNREVQNEGWHFNTEHHIKSDAYRDTTTKYITIPTNVLRMDIHEEYLDKYKDVVKRNGRLYDKVNHTDEFTEDIYMDFVWLLEFTDIPSVFQRYIIAKASTRAATQLVSNPQLVALLQQQEAQTRASCMEYECNQGDHNFMGFPHETAYRTYKPHTVLQR